MEKPETREALAEWICEKVLDCPIHFNRWIKPAHLGIAGKYHFEDFVYSPEGFFAVWGTLGEEFTRKDYAEFMHGYVDVLYGEHNNYPDKYEAFYNAIWETNI